LRHRFVVDNAGNPPSRTSFETGDEVTVVVEPVKGGQPVGRIPTAILADGQKLVAAAASAPRSPR
jgi:hypothetical protein